MARILVGWDGSETSDGALEYATGMVGEDDELLVVTVIPARLKDRSFLHMLFPQIDIPDAMEGNSYEKNARNRIEERVDGLEVAASVQPVVRMGDPADELLALCRDEEIDHLVIGFKSYEADLPFHVGSVAEKLVRYCEVPITVYRPKQAPAA